MSTVLVVDDDENSRLIMIAFLEDMGHVVHTARSGNEVLQAVAASTPDLILLDVVLPIINGWMVTAQLKAHPRFNHIPVVVVTGHVSRTDEERAFTLGAYGYLTKPIQSEALEAMVRGILDR